MNVKHPGSCLCGEIKYVVKQFQSEVAHCHCRMCRKHTGSSHATYASVLAHNFQWLQGEDLLKTYIASNGAKRSFCPECGSSLVFEGATADEEVVEISLATLDGDSPVQPNAHIFLNYKANWAILGDELQHYLEGRMSI